MPQTSPMILQETQDFHNALMVNRFGIAMRSETLPRDKYVELLQSYAVIYHALEESLRSSQHPSVVTVWREDLCKAVIIVEDLTFFKVTSGAEQTPSTANLLAEQLAEKMRGSAGADLLGCLYVMEGSTLGAEAVLRQHVESAYGLDAHGGAAYFNCGDRTQWHEFNRRLDSAVVDPGEQRTVLTGAIMTYQCVIDIQNTIH